VIFGGDGTLLSVARRLAATGMTLLGVNMGKLGFLANFTIEDLRKYLDDIISGKVGVSERLMLSVSITDSGEGFVSTAANDVSINSGEPFRMIDLDVAQGKQRIARYLGDGLVVATPTGSTGYSLSAGGPIMQPTVEAVVITPVAPHSLSLRPMVVTPEPPIRITATNVNPGTTMMIDGQEQKPLTEGETVEVSLAESPMKIVTHPELGYFGTLADKLHWGRSPHH
jgi:NAD+ kinase